MTNEKHEYVTHEDGGQVILHLSPPGVGGGAAAGPSFRTGLSLLAAVVAAVHTMRRFRGFSLAHAPYRAAVRIIFLKSKIIIFSICIDKHYYFLEIPLSRRLLLTPGRQEVWLQCPCPH